MKNFETFLSSLIISSQLHDSSFLTEVKQLIMSYGLSDRLNSACERSSLKGWYLPALGEGIFSIIFLYETHI
jgi:hypothetical protein